MVRSTIEVHNFFGQSQSERPSLSADMSVAVKQSLEGCATVSAKVHNSEAESINRDDNKGVKLLQLFRAQEERGQTWGPIELYLLSVGEF